MVSLKDERVLVLGASSGVGYAAAVMFAGEGARVVASARRADRLAGLERETGAAVFPADAGDAAAMERLAAFAVERMGGIDVMVYAAGTNTPERALTRLTVPIWDHMLSTNLDGAYYITRAVLPGMRAARKGHLIYVSSISGRYGDVSGAAYQASKSGMRGLARAVRVEEKDNGIRTCVILPGLIDTELLTKRPAKTPADLLAKAMQAEDVAEAILDVARLNPRAAVTELEIHPTYI
jgi:NADP-dependent 3-hydroxy acid dehydrogenase YdfG